MRLALLTILITMLVTDSAAAWCGFDRRPPTHGRPGFAPLALGDSVLQGAARPLARVGFDVDASCGRSPRGGISVLENRRRRGTLPEIVVFALGTNVYMTSGDIGRALRVLGPRRTLMLVTPVRAGRPFSTAPMRRAARRRPNRVRLIDWSRHALRNRYWLGGDGTHLTPSGAVAYTRLLKRAAWSRQRGRFMRPHR
jgi:hypothetical protein